MCGICGIVDYRTNQNIDKEIILSMCGQMKHRGPDDEGLYINNNYPSIGLGHRRLSIIDLSSAGHQPMSNEDGKLWIVFNGEVYNFKELKHEVIKKGHDFKSNTDTETILHLYEEYAEDCLDSLIGMFAFAIWDENERSLFLARDRVGKKPLIYYYNNGIFCFASEFLALFQSRLIEKMINWEAINYYLTFGYIPAPLTIYKNVYKLLPGHYLKLKNESLFIKKYWDLNYSEKYNISEGEAAEEVLKLLTDAVKLRLNSDVPFGAFLSGGIDSSTVVGLMSQLCNKNVKTFSIGFKEKNYNELKYATNIAKYFNTEHNEFIVEPKALEVIPLLVERFGEPYADSSSIPTYYVSNLTKQYVTVALNGDGGDEVFAGYERYQAMILSDYYHKMPIAAQKLVKMSKWLFKDSIDQKNLTRRIRRFLNGIDLDFQQRYIKWVGIFDGNLKGEIFSDEFNQITSQNSIDNFFEQFNSNSNLSSLDSLLFTDTMTYLPNDLLVKVDITSMANSLEARSPFLDHRLMEFVARLPVKYKLNNFVKKYILKKAIKDIIPKENIYRKKMGFGIPVGDWFRNDIKDFLYDTLMSEKALGRGYFKPKTVEGMVNSHIEKRSDYTFQLWALLMLELWHQRFIG